ncbi:MAG TPA: glutamate synthase large subunit [Actinomycetes bacterium]|nr:glutamate synthase large subunit [Actinomycetes bacterium]
MSRVLHLSGTTRLTEVARLSPPLTHPSFEHDACGVGFVARVDGRGSREIVDQGLEVLERLAHRGATGADPDTGDGAGILVQVPDRFLRRVAAEDGIALPPAGWFGTGMVFLSADREQWRRCERGLERIAAEEGQRVLGWRDVPVEPLAIGRMARQVAPRIRQVFIERTTGDQDAFERKLYVIRRRLHRAVAETFDAKVFYIVSLSSRTLVYKGLLQGPQVRRFYGDLNDRAFTSALALVHSRFSTNTLGSWRLAHPYRYVAHNGEINTLKGNLNWMRAREAQLDSDAFGTDMRKLHPVIEPGVSDSAAFDNALEFLVLAGRSLPQAVMTMIPEAWENDAAMDPDRRAFYQYATALMQPWDGPAAIAFSDGRLIGATLDRNGLRPARWSVTGDGLVVMASEEGVLDLPAREVTERSRLRPGGMLVVDTERGLLHGDDDVKRAVVARRPYRAWTQAKTIRLDDLPAANGTPVVEPSTLLERQRAFGYSNEDLRLLLAPMARDGKEPDGSMGADTPLAVLSTRPRLLFDYFKQLFAQVTNPAIDPLREGLVMSLKMRFGPERNLLDETEEHCRRVVLEQPVVGAGDLARLRAIPAPFEAVTLPLIFDAAAAAPRQGPEPRGGTRPDGAGGLDRALRALCEDAGRAVAAGATTLVLSDRGVRPGRVAVPSLLATAAVHHHLVRTGARTAAALLVETGEAREVHHMALLIGFGATAVNPYVALETVAALAGGLGLTPEQAVANYVGAIGKGLRKVISKLGISTLYAYCGAQLFEAVGLDPELVERWFTGTASRVGGIGLDGLARELLERHERAFAALALGPPELDPGGEYQLRTQGQYHLWNDRTVVALQRAVRTNSFETYEQFSLHYDAEASRLATLRGLLDLERAPIPLEGVEPAAGIVRRFATGAMSLGSISSETHETLAIAMNRIRGRSNTGEGGEDPARSVPDPNGDLRRSAIKQVASARFGVTASYLVDADQLQIKIAQGAKPGEGGQLPGHKVSELIARLRHATPGVGLISPPPHHDIYSIEDLAQLIHDLKCVNPAADVSVKLVAEVGVGTIAAGVAKAKADHIVIAGHDGGTGASPLSSIKHAGLPWELGIAETQQVLVANGLRGRVRLQVDGGLRTGRDVVVGGLLGAEEFGFSTAPLVALGCIMMRVCHLNTCPVGIATQDPELRRRFTGTPEHVVNYFFFVAEEVRRLMAALGFRRFDDLVGRADRLRSRTVPGHPKAATVDLSALLVRADSDTDAGAAEPPEPHSSRPAVSHAPRRVERQDHGLDQALDNKLIELATPALERREPVRIELPIRNVDGSVGGMLSGEVARRCGPEGLPDGTVHLRFTGTAGQSFAAWGAPGLLFELTGEANDYTGKGLSGATLVVAPPADAGYLPERSIVVGNTVLYGATGGHAFLRGVAGERFAVRNSGAVAVVEGCGDHGCEYMTGGTVVVLGEVGRNFAAGMSGGTAFVHDPAGRLAERCNLDMVGLEPLADPDDEALLRGLLGSHLGWTGSAVAARLLDDWPRARAAFAKVMPHDYKRVLEQRRKAPRVGLGV